MPEHFQQELEKLKTMTGDLSSNVFQCLEYALQALHAGDVGLSDAVVGRSKRLAGPAAAVERQAFDMLALKAPLAGDLRYVVSVLKLKTDLLRIAQQAANVAEEVPYVAAGPNGKQTPENLAREGVAVLSMARDCFQALTDIDAETARQVIARDDEVDALYNQMHDDTERGIQEHPECTDVYIRYLKVARELERIADHLVNICEDIDFAVSGAARSA